MEPHARTRGRGCVFADVCWVHTLSLQEVNNLMEDFFQTALSDSYRRVV
jgi:hypothetical protein